MIFSTDRCPLCNDKLELEILEPAQGKIAFRYYCKKTEGIRNRALDPITLTPHYQNHSFQGGQLTEMVIPPFYIAHSESNKMTSVYDALGTQTKKLIFRTKLLDLDYSQPQVVVDKLKLLVTFS